jgi:hypothetical protein
LVQLFFMNRARYRDYGSRPDILYQSGTTTSGSSPLLPVLSKARGSRRET